MKFSLLIVPLNREAIPYTSHQTRFQTKMAKVYYVCASKKGEFWRRFCQKMGIIDFGHFGLESGLVFEETTEVYESTVQMIQRERAICDFEMGFKKSFCSKNDDFISTYTRS